MYGLKAFTLKNWDTNYRFYSRYIILCLQEIGMWLNRVAVEIESVRVCVQFMNF